MHQKIIAVDFDGTLSSAQYPVIGQPNTALIEYLNCAKKSGYAIVLWTCREGNELYEALEWCKEQGLTFDAVNENPKFIYFESRKVVADIYIDDCNLDNGLLKAFWEKTNYDLSNSTPR